MLTLWVFSMSDVTSNYATRAVQRCPSSSSLWWGDRSGGGRPCPKQSPDDPTEVSADAWQHVEVVTVGKSHPVGRQHETAESVHGDIQEHVYSMVVCQREHGYHYKCISTITRAFLQRRITWFVFNQRNGVFALSVTLTVNKKVIYLTMQMPSTCISWSRGRCKHLSYHYK